MIHIGIIGVGRIGRGRHIEELQKVQDAEITAICDINPTALQEIGDRLGIPPEHRYADYHRLICDPAVDAVEICTPNYLHVGMAMDVLKAGKPVNVEKPLGTSMEQVKPLAEYLQSGSLKNMMCFSYRFMPAVRYAKELLDGGALGKLIHVDVAYLQSGAFIEGRRLEWRFQKALAGSGALADLGVHLLDMTRLLIGEVHAVNAVTGTVVNRRQKLDSEEWADVTVDDFCSFLAEIGDGTVGNFTVTRCALGHSNTIKYDIYGTEGVISFNLNQPEIINLCMKKDVGNTGMHTVEVPQQYFVGQEQTFIDLLNGKQIAYLPTLADGIKCQAILDAVQKSAEQHCRVVVEE